MDSPLYELVRQCTVRVSIGQSNGTGFFVAPGVVLTCAHVVEIAQNKNVSLQVYWQGNSYSAQIDTFLAKPYPDLSLLKLNLLEHPCVYLHESIQLGDKLYGYGYSDEYPDGDSITVEYEGPTGGPEQLLKLKMGQVRPGLSGSPLLNLRTGGICGIIKKSRDVFTDLGGRAVPTSIVLSKLNLTKPQAEFHQEDNHWFNSFLLDALAYKISYLEIKQLVSSIFRPSVFDNLNGNSQLDKAKSFLGRLAQTDQKESFLKHLVKIRSDLNLSILGQYNPAESEVGEPAPPQYSIDFANREPEWERVVLYPEGQYYLFEGPAGYGKSALLTKIDKEFKRRDWLSVYVSLEQHDHYVKAARHIAQVFSLEIEENIYIESSRQIGVELGKTIARKHDPGKENGLAILLDVDQKPYEYMLSALRTMVIEVIPAIYDGLTGSSNFFKITPTSYRIVIAGRYLASTVDIFNTYHYKVTQLKPFNYSVISEICINNIKTTEQLNEFAANLLFYSGGHPSCMVRILDRFDEAGCLPSDFFPSHHKQVNRDADEEASLVHNSIKYDYQSIFDTLCIYRRLDSPLLKKFLERFGWVGDEYDLIVKLRQSYLLNWSDGGRRHLSDDITRRMLVIRLRNAISSELFRDACSEAKDFCISRLKSTKEYRQYWAVEALFEFLQGNVSEIYDREKRQNLRQKFLNEELPNILRVLVEGYDDPRSEYEPLLGAISNEQDWEFYFTVNYYLRDEIYDDSSYQEMLEVINQFFENQKQD